MSILSPIEPSRFQVNLVDYGNASPGDIFSFPAFTTNSTAIININCKLLTTIDVADRMIYLSLTRGSLYSYFAPSQQVQTANKAIWYSFAPGNNSPASPDQPFIACAVPPDLLMLKGDILSIKVIGGQLNDEINYIMAYWKIFPTG